MMESMERNRGVIPPSINAVMKRILIAAVRHVTGIHAAVTRARIDDKCLRVLTHLLSGVVGEITRIYYHRGDGVIKSVRPQLYLTEKESSPQRNGLRGKVTSIHRFSLPSVSNTA